MTTWFRVWCGYHTPFSAVPLLVIQQPVNIAEIVTPSARDGGLQSATSIHYTVEVSLQLAISVGWRGRVCCTISWNCGAIHERWSHVRYDIGRTTDVVATIRPIHESGRKK